MKLLRLQSTSANDGNYEANFMEDIDIPKNSKLCLKNISFKRIFEILKIDTTNNAVFLEMTGEQDITFNLEQTTYTQFNFNSFLEDLVKKLNNNIPMTNGGSFVGLSFNVVQETDFFQLQAKKSPVFFNRQFIDQVKTSENISCNAQNRISKLTPHTDSDGNNTDVNTAVPDRLYFQEDIKFVRGSGILACKIGQLGNDPDNNNGFFIGLGDAPSNSATILFNIEIRGSGLNYTFISNGATPVDSGLAPQHFNAPSTLNQKDILEIRKDNGFIIGTVRQVAGSTELFSHLLTSEQQDIDLYPIFGVYGSNANARISLPRFNMELSATQRILGTESFTYSNSDITTVFNSVRNPVDKILSFVTLGQEIKSIFNFRRDFDTDNFFWAFTNDEGIDFNIEDDNYVVESLSVDLLSYDSTRQRRMNILATFPFANDRDGVVNYEPNERLCVSVNNNFDLTLRNFKFRVLDKNLNTIKTTGGDIMTILVEDSNE